MIKFTEETGIEKYKEENHPIQLEKFRFRNANEFLELANKGEELPDVIGYLCENISKPGKRAVLRLLLEEVTAWDDMVDNLFEKFTKTRESTIIMIITSLNPKTFGRDLFLNTTSSTKFYLNPEFPTVREFRERTKAKSHEITILRGDDIPTQSRAMKRISEILEYTLEQNKQEAEFICKAGVKEILAKNGWSYIACSACSKKIEKMNNKLSCTKCSNPQAIGILRFRIEAIVADGSAETTFVIFDKEANKFINKTAAEIMNEEEVTEEKSKETQTVLECLSSMVGKIFTFQIKVTNFNFSAQRQSFTVSRILDQTTKESEKTVLGNGENPKGTKREREGSQKIEMREEEIERETGNITAEKEVLEKKKIKTENISEDGKYAGLGGESNENGSVPKINAKEAKARD